MEFVYLVALLIKLDQMESVSALLEIKLLMENVHNVQDIHNMLMEYVYVMMEIIQLMDNVKCYLVLILTMFMIQ